MLQQAILILNGSGFCIKLVIFEENHPNLPFYRSEYGRVDRIHMETIYPDEAAINHVDTL